MARSMRGAAKRPSRPQVVTKAVGIGNRDPRFEDPRYHYAAAAGIFVLKADLYDNRKKGNA